MIVRTNISSIFKRITLGFASFALVLGSVSAAVPVFLTEQVNAISSTTVTISNVAELRDAVAGQADGQTWTINAGNYGLDRFNDITVEKENGWYLPITANNLTINGVGNPTLFGKEYSTDGNWSSQNLVSIFGDNVTLNGLTLMPKVEPNKTIEVLGANATIKNVVITPNTLTDQSQYDNIYYSSDPSWTQDAKTWGGSLYFSHAGNHTVENVTIKNSGVSFRYAPSGTHVTFINTKLDFATNVNWINQYRYSSGFNNPGSTISGAPQVTYSVNSTLNNLDSVLASAQNGDTVNINSNLTTSKQITVSKALTINGNGNTISPSFSKSDTGNNSVIGIQSNDVTINNLIVNGTGGTGLHGINVYAANGVNLDDITSKNNSSYGVVVNSSTVTVSNIQTFGNGWGGVDVDQKATPVASLTVNGTSTHSEAGADIYIDDKTKAVSVSDTNAQYGSQPSGILGRPNDLVYKIKLAAPTVLTPANNSYTNNSSFDNTWSVVSGAVKYEYETTFMLNGTTQTYADTSASGNYVVGPTTVTRHNNKAPESTYTWKVRGVDALGIKGSWSTVSKVTVDTIKPIAPLNGQPGVTGTNDFYFTWNLVTDNGSPVVEYQFQSSGSSVKDADGSLVGAWKNWTSYVTPEQKTLTTPTIHSTGAPDGTYYWQARAVDAAGNVGAWSQIWNTKIDSTAPAAPVLKNATMYLNASELNKQAEWTQTGTDVDHFEYREYMTAEAAAIDDAYWTPVSASNKFSQTVGSSWGTKTLYYTVVAVDAAGNRSPRSELGTIIIDRDAPVAPENLAVKVGTASLANPGRTNSYGITTSWNGVSDAVKYQYRVWNDVAGSDFNTEATAYTAPLQSETSRYGEFTLGEGTHYIQVRAIDASGNVSPWTESFVVTYDKTEPVATIKTIVTDVALPVITGTLDDQDVTDLTVKLDGKTLRGVTRTGNNWSVATVNPLKDGLHRVEVTGTDVAGNTFTEVQTFTAALPVVVPVVQTPATPTVTTPTAVVTPRSLPQNLVAFTTPAATTDATTPEAEVLGATIATDDKTDVAGVQDTNKDSATTNENKNESGSAWWWLLVFPAAGASWWAVAALRNRNS